MIARHFSRSAANPAPAGFTLVELLVVIAIAAILVSIAVPSLQDTVQRNRADTASNQFAAVLAMARSEAIKQGTTVSVCALAAGLPCPAGTTTFFNWGGGWNVCCVPGTSAASASGNASYLPIQTGAALTGPMTHYGNTQTISFDATGRLPIGTSLLFIFCPDGVDPTKGYAVELASSGRVRVVPPKNGQAPVDDAGQPVSSCSAPT